MWTREQSDQAQYLRSLGMTVTEIAAKFGFTRVQVSKWLSRDYARRRRYGERAIEKAPRSRCVWSKEEHEQAVQMHKDGRSVADIAAAVLRSEAAIFSYLRKQGFSLKKPVVLRPLHKYEVTKVERDDLIRNGLYRTNRLFLVDLLKASGFEVFGDAKAAYIAKNELRIEEGSARPVWMSWFDGSAIGSPSEMCAG